MTLLSTAQAAERIGVSPRRVQQFVQEGRLRRSGEAPEGMRGHLFDPEEVETFAQIERKPGPRRR